MIPDIRMIRVTLGSERDARAYVCVADASERRDEGRLAVCGPPSHRSSPNGSSDDLLSRDQPIHDHDERNDEQGVDEPAADMEGEEAKGPENEQDDRNGE